MRTPAAAWRKRTILTVLALFAIPLVWAAEPVGRFAASLFRPDYRLELEKIEKASVRRVDLSSRVVATGRIISSVNTVVECKLERLEFRNQGRALTTDGSSMILTLVDEGTSVKKGDVLCTLDSSEYEEIVRQHAIRLDRAKADLVQAQLELDVARMSVKEYEEGLRLQDIKSMTGQISLHEADLKRAEDRLDWSTRMLEKGYVSLQQVESDRYSLRKVRHSLEQAQLSLKNFEIFVAQKKRLSLQNGVIVAEGRYANEKDRYGAYVERMNYYKKMVENCTIRAPHDGYVIYARDDDDDKTMIEVGARVRQRQDLFLLPDLNQMEAVAYVHESVIPKIETGMRASVFVEGLHGREVVGSVTDIRPIPTMPSSLRGLQYYLTNVKLENVPNGLKPEMTAEVRIITKNLDEVLAVPPEAIFFEDGKEFCFVSSGDQVQRRSVTLGRTNSADYLEVRKGLEENEVVMLDPEAAREILAAAEPSALIAREAPTVATAADPTPPTVTAIATPPTPTF